MKFCDFTAAVLDLSLRSLSTKIILLNFWQLMILLIKCLKLPVNGSPAIPQFALKVTKLNISLIRRIISPKLSALIPFQF